MATVRRSLVDPDVELIHSTYEDNPFLPPDYVETLQKLAGEDENYYKIYALGDWGEITKRIYVNYKIIPELPAMEKSHWGYGLDYGLVNQSAIVKCHLYQDRVYAEERLYRTGMTVADIIEFLSHESRGDIWADPSAKMMTEEIRRAGYSAFDGLKGVKEGIDLCQRQTIFIPESSVNIIKEIRSYQWKSDKLGNILPEPIKFNDHLMDALRYVIWGLTARFGFPTQRPTTSEPIKSLTFGGQADNNKILERWLRRGNG